MSAVSSAVTLPQPLPAEGLRVLAFCDYFGPSAGGGAERVAHEVYRRLAGVGAEVTVLTTSGAGRGWREAEGLRIVDVPALDLRRLLRVQASVTRGARRRAAELLREVRPHLLHANSLQFQTSLAAARVQHRFGVPLVLTAHIGGFELVPQPWRTLASAHERTVGRYLLARSRRVIAVSDAVAGHLRRYPRVAERVRVVPNGVDHSIFRPSARLPDDDGELSLVLVGRLVPNKGPELALVALAALRRAALPVRLTIVGDGPLRASLEMRATELGIADRVRFAGTSDDVASHLRAADVLVRPTLTEGMPLAVLEAMASGVCVVASDVPGNAGLVRHGETGLLVPVGDAASLADALRRVCVDAVERRRLARAGQLASLAHSWDRCARETLSVFVEALGETR